MKTVTQFNSIESFETTHLYAVKLTENDLDALVQMHDNESVMKTLGGVRTRETTIENLNWNLRQWEENGFGLWMFYDKNTKRWLGRGGLRRVIVADKQEIELGYAILPEYWNKGYATEIARACLEIAFEVLRLKNVVCFTLPTNHASQRVMQKAGFEFESNVIMTYEGVTIPHVLYRIQTNRVAVLAPYDQSWPMHYKDEATRLKNLFGTTIKAIHHIGSTAIPSLPAKPIIDILIEFEDINLISELKPKFTELGYLHISRQIIPLRSFFTHRHEPTLSFNLHLYERGDPQVKRHLNFRDYCIAHPEVASQYAQTKLELAQRYQHDIYNYVLGKDKLVQAIDRKAKLYFKERTNMLPPHIRDENAPDLLAAMIANFNVYLTYYPQYIEEVLFKRIPGYTLIDSGIANSNFNYVLDCDFTKAQSAEKITEITTHFQHKQLPFTWWVTPFDEPDDLVQRLKLNTLSYTPMYLSLKTTPAKVTTPLHIERIHTPQGFADFASVLAPDKKAYQTFFSWVAAIYTDDDPIEFYVGYKNEIPVVRGAICFYAGCVGFYGLATAEQARNKGYAHALQAFAIDIAQKRGFKVALLRSAPMYLNFNAEMGFLPLSESAKINEIKLI